MNGSEDVTVLTASFVVNSDAQFQNESDGMDNTINGVISLV